MYKEEHIQKVKELAEELNWDKDKSISTTPEEIQEMENKLNLRFPKEYKEFLQTFCCLQVYGMDIFGCGDGLLSATRETIENQIPPYPPAGKFPENLVVTSDNGFGDYYCLVCGGIDDGKIIFWQHDVYPEQAYPNYPPDKGPDFWIEGPDFWTWLLNKLNMIKKAKEDSEGQEREIKRAERSEK